MHWPMYHITLFRGWGTKHMSYDVNNQYPKHKPNLIKYVHCTIELLIGNFIIYMRGGGQNTHTYIFYIYIYIIST